jgi:hypothetical protein
MELENYECPICFQLNVEPVKLTTCKHVFCLSCIERLLINGEHRCPLDRSNFNYRINLEYESQHFSILAKYKKEITLEAVNKNIKARKENTNLLELALHYGNLHRVMLQANSHNQHLWKVYVRIRKSNSDVRGIIGKLFEENEKDIEKYLNIKFDNSNKAKDDKYKINDSDVIKSVLFRLHPTFRPPQVLLTRPPFAVERIGWGIFNVSIVVKFHDNLNMEKMVLDHFLSFDGEKSDNVKLIYVDPEKALQNRNNNINV